MSDVRRMVRAGLANRFNNALGRLLQFGNACHNPAGSGEGGEFCEKVGGMSDGALAAEKRNIQDHFKGNEADQVRRRRLAEISAEQRRRDAGGVREVVVAPTKAAPASGGGLGFEKLQALRAPNAKEGTKFFPGDQYKGAPVRVVKREAWIDSGDLDTEKVTFRNKKGKEVEGTLREFIKDQLKGYAVVREDGKVLDPRKQNTDHGLYRAHQYGLGGLYSGSPPPLAQMISGGPSVINEERPSHTARENRAGGNQLTRMYRLGGKGSNKVLVSAVVDPRDGRVITSGVEFVEGTLISKADIPRLRDRVEEWHTANGTRSGTRLEAV